MTCGRSIFTFWLTLFSLTLLGLTGCGTGADGLPPAVAACPAGAAMLAVRDGSLQRLCGCTEGEALIAPPAALSCTVSAGTVVFFQYTSTTLTHQIVPSSPLTAFFVPSPLSDPKMFSSL